MNDSKKKATKKIVLKNKKEATRILSRKSSDKNQNKKVVQKQNKKAPILKNKKIDNVGKDSELKTRKEKLVINKDDLIKEEPIIYFKEKKAKLTTNTSKKDIKKVKNDKKEEKRKLKELKKLEERKEKLEKEKIKDEKKKLKQEQASEKKLKKAEVKKEKQVISQKKSTNLKQKDIKEKRNSIFEEEIEEQKEIKKKEKVKKSTGKALITFAIMLLLFLGSVVVVNKLKGRMKSTLNMYTPYKTGELVTLKDSSKWYVIADSSADKPTVKLLKELPIDLNENGNIDTGDQTQYSKDGKVQYDSSVEGSIANYLETKYKSELTEKVGKIENISLLTSEEYVKARNKMGYSYEWSEGNWLASSTLGTWWLGSSKKDGVLVVTPKGNYRLYSVGQQGYVRPVITIDKDLVKKG